MTKNLTVLNKSLQFNQNEQDVKYNKQGFTMVKIRLKELEPVAATKAKVNFGYE